MGVDGSQQPQLRAAGQWDGLVTQLQTWRRAAGELSFSDISLRISENRQAQGLPEAAARVGRSTVYDAFRLGRARLNLDLVREICAALEVPDDEVEAAIRESLEPTPVPHPRADTSDELAARTPAADSPEPEQPEVHHEPEVTPVAAPNPVPARAPISRPAPSPTATQALLLIVACVAINLLGRSLIDLFHLPLYLDMVGTAIAAIALGPWRGALVGILTGALGAITIGWVSAAFIPVSVAGALAWGYGVRRFGWGRSLPRFFGLATMTSLLCALVAAPTLIIFFDGSVGHDQDNVAKAAGAFLHAWVMTVSLANVLTSFFDKTISSFVALVAISLLPPPLRPRPGLLVTLEGPRLDEAAPAGPGEAPMSGSAA